jgi:hypothetical protein
MSAHTKPFIAVSPNSCNCELQIPPSLEAALTPEQQLAVSKIRLKHAHDVAQSAASALAEVTKLVHDQR